MRLLVAVLVACVGGGLGDKVPGQYVVVLHQMSQEEQKLLNDEVSALGLGSEMVRIEAGGDGGGFYALLVTGVADEALLQGFRLRHRGRVASIEQDETVREAAFKDIAIKGGVEDTHALQCLSGAPRPTEQGYWGLRRIVPTPYSINPEWGLGVDVYVIDTGVNCSHPELAGRCLPGWSPGQIHLEGSYDVSGHGSHVAGTIAGSRSGIARAATIIPARVAPFKNESTLASIIIRGVEYAVAQKAARKRPSVINLSLGSGSLFAVTEAVNAAVKAGAHVVVSAGNDNDGACGVHPASSTSAITVGSIGSDNRISYFSNHGPCVDLFAPGLGVLSLDAVGGTGLKSGTSMAAPHVAGVVAAYLSRRPGATTHEVKHMLKSTAARDAVLGDLHGAPNLLLQLHCVGEPEEEEEVVVVGGGKKWRPSEGNCHNSFGDGYRVSEDGAVRSFTAPEGGGRVCWWLEGACGGAASVVRFANLSIPDHTMKIFSRTGGLLAEYANVEARGVDGPPTVRLGAGAVLSLSGTAGGGAAAVDLAFSCAVMHSGNACTGESSVFTTPSGVLTYAADQAPSGTGDACWTIKCDKAVLLDFQDFNLTHEASFLSIDDSSRFTTILSGSDRLPAKRYLPGDLKIRFTAAGSVAGGRDGFSVAWKCVAPPPATPQPVPLLRTPAPTPMPVSPDCVRPKGTSGEIAYPPTGLISFEGNDNLCWFLDCGAKPVVITMRGYFTEMWYDSLQARGADGSLLKLWHGSSGEDYHDGVAQWVAPVGNLSLLFRTDGSVEGFGFALDWQCGVPAPKKQECQASSETRGDIEYPPPPAVNFGNYESECWMIDCGDKYVNLNITDFSLFGPYRAAASLQAIEAQTGDVVATWGRYFSYFQTKQLNWNGPSGKLLLRFASDGLARNSIRPGWPRGFNLTWQCEAPPATSSCAVLNGNGTIAREDFFFVWTYADNEDVCWMMDCNEDEHLFVEFVQRFDTEEHFDRLEARGLDGELLKIWTGTIYDFDDDWLWMGPRSGPVVLRFKTDESGSAGRMRFKWRCAKPRSKECVELVPRTTQNEVVYPHATVDATCWSIDCGDKHATVDVKSTSIASNEELIGYHDGAEVFKMYSWSKSWSVSYWRRKANGHEMAPAGKFVLKLAGREERLTLLSTLDINLRCVSPPTLPQPATPTPVVRAAASRVKLDHSTPRISLDCGTQRVVLHDMAVSSRGVLQAYGLFGRPLETWTEHNETDHWAGPYGKVELRLQKGDRPSEVRWECESHATCEGAHVDLVGQAGRLDYPGTSGTQYGDRMNVCWRVCRGGLGKVRMLKLDLEPQFDVVRVYGEGAVAVPSFTGRRDPDPREWIDVSDGLVRFESDYSGTGTGFGLEWECRGVEYNVLGFNGSMYKWNGEFIESLVTRFAERLPLAGIVFTTRLFCKHVCRPGMEACDTSCSGAGPGSILFGFRSERELTDSEERQVLHYINTLTTLRTTARFEVQATNTSTRVESVEDSACTPSLSVINVVAIAVAAMLLA